MMVNDIEIAAVVIHSEEAPLMSRWDTADAGVIYTLELPDAGVSIPLMEVQVRALGAAILSATLDEVDEDDDL
jgi:hypothetical protein